MNDDRAAAILRSIRRIMRRVDRYSRRLRDDTGLTVPQLLCLQAIDGLEGDVTVKALCVEIQLSASTVSGILDRLERADLVVRTRDKRDRRKVLLSLTEQGQAHIADNPALQDLFVRRLGQLADAEQESILVALDRVAELMDADQIDALPVLLAGTLEGD